jgi:hypothetical protein
MAQRMHPERNQLALSRHDLLFPNAAGNVEIYQNIHQRLCLPLMKSVGTCRS